MTSSLKALAAQEAARLIEGGQRLGLGSGSTAELFIAALGERIARGELEDVVGVATSKATAEVARRHAVPLVSLAEAPRLHVAIDGADEIDTRLDLLKGRGGALLREKIVACASERFVVIADESKIVEALGTRTRLPVEALPFGWRRVAGEIARLGAKVELRQTAGDVFLTDQGNCILDCDFGPIGEAASLSRELDSIAGVLGHGLFVGMADEVIVGTARGIEIVLAPERA